MRSRARHVEPGAGRQRQGAGGRRQETQPAVARCADVLRAGPARIRHCARFTRCSCRAARRRPIVDKLADALNKGLNEEAVQKRLAELGADSVEQEPPRTQGPRRPGQKRIRAADADSESRGGEREVRRGIGALHASVEASQSLVPRQIIRANGRGARRRHVEAHRNAFQLRARRRIKLHHQRIMPRHDMALVRRQRQQPVEPLQHFADMKGGRERPLARHVLVEMADVGGEHDKTRGGS